MKTTTCTYEYICSVKNVIPNNDKETSVPYKICSFDIEASSSHGDFPVPIKTYKWFATNMVDVFLKQKAVLNEEKGKLLIEKMVSAAFDYDTFEDIDRVYPKMQQPSKEKVGKLCANLISKSLERFKKDEDEDNSDLIQIDTIFDEMNNRQMYVNEDGEEGEQNNDYEEKEYVSYKSKKAKLKKNTKLVDILFDEKYSRDEKVKIVDEVLTTSFPRLKGDEVTFIGSTFMKYGEGAIFEPLFAIVGTCDDVEERK